MTTLIECDWCNSQHKDKEKTHPVDITHGANVINAHVCDSCFESWELSVG